MIKYILIFALVLTAVGIAHASGSFTVDAFSDTYIDENNKTTNYNTAHPRVGIVTGKDMYTLLYSATLFDSIRGRLADSAVITAYTSTVSGSFGSDDSISVWAVLPLWRDNEATWNVRTSIESWTAIGAEGSGTDIYTVMIDKVPVQGWTADSIAYFDVHSSFDSLGVDSGTATFWGWILHQHNFSNGAYIAFSGEDPAFPANDFSIYVEYSNDSTRQDIGCYGTPVVSGAYQVAATKGWAKDVDCYIDSMKLHMDDGGGTGDTMIAVVYRAYGDTALLAQSIDTLLTDGGTNNECHWYTFEFSGDDYIMADSEYYWGVYIADDPDVWDFCRTRTVASGICRWKYVAPLPANMQSATAASEYCPCFYAYLTEKTEAGPAGQVIIIGSCLEGEVYFDEENGRKYRRHADGSYRLVEFIFGG